MDISEAACAELSNLMQHLNAKIGMGDGHEELEREAERHFQAMRDSFKRVVKNGKSDVFVRYLLEQLEKDAAIFTEAASKDVLRVSEHQFGSAQLILDAFGTGSHVLRYTWKLNPGQRLFDDLGWRRHFELTSSMAVSGALEIRTVFIADHHQQYEAANVQKLLEYFACQEGMDAKVVMASDWESGMVDHGIPTSCVDFGIYGEKLLFTADTYTPVDIGKWSKSPADIKRFTRFFDKVWNGPAIAADAVTAPAQQVTLSQLMKVDSSFERRKDATQEQNTVHETVARIEERIRSEVA